MADSIPVIIFTDGACSGNPGPGGYCAIMRYGSHEKVLQGGASLTTNNRMELRAALAAFQALTRPCVVEIHTDSEYVKKGVTEWMAGWLRNGWRTSTKQPVKNRDLWQALNAAMKPHRISLALGQGPRRRRVQRARRSTGRGRAEHHRRERPTGSGRPGRRRAGVTLATRYSVTGYWLLVTRYWSLVTHHPSPTKQGNCMDDYSELAGETPDTIKGIRLDLADLGGPAAELSTGLILTWRDKLVFGLEPHATPLGAQGRDGVAAFTGIGGHLDPGERWTDAVVREAMEEACCPVSLGDSEITYFCRQDEAPYPIMYRWAEPYRPLLVWVATFWLRRGPNRERMPVTLVNAVFRSAALSRPVPSAEMYGLILMDRAALLHAYAEPRPLGELLAMGAQVVGQSPPPETLIAPGGSAFFYAQWLAWQGSG